MKTHFLKFTFAFGMVVLCLSCTTKTYDIELEGFEPRLVLQCFFNEGEPFVVYVTSTMRIDSEEFYSDTIENAEVNLYKDGIFQESLVWNEYYLDPHRIRNRVYCSDSAMGESGSTYRLEVSAPGFDPVFAESTIPEKTWLKYLYHDYDTTIQDIAGVEDFQLYLNTYLKMQNPEDIRNFYFFVSRINTWRDPYDLLELSDPRINDPILGNTLDLYNSPFGWGDPDYLLFTNEFIQSDEYEFIAKFWVDNAYSLGGDRRIYFNLATLSSEAYEYMTSRTIQRNLDQRFSEPAWVYSNVEGGAGIFAGVNIATDSLILPIYYGR
ncbi:MAG: DUF4249 domain-containing protein [Bacteroidales bacterium]|nr:DUF4249 domain-containing protein [Bacteroidales bacterium]